MSRAVERDTDAVLAGLVAWLAASVSVGEPEVVGVERPTVGYSTETILVDVSWPGAADRSGERLGERLVLKLPPAGDAIFPTYDFVAQGRVQDAVAAAGIPAPTPVRVELDETWMGTPFLVMPAVAGHIVGELPLFDRWLTDADADANARVHGCYLDAVADINRVDWRAAGLDRVLPARDNAAELAHWRRYLDWCAGEGEPWPTLVEALDWCAAHQPAGGPAPGLCWGDVRLGNVIFDDNRTPVAVLDWEMASIGAAEHDLAWLLTLEAIPRELLGRTVPGFLTHDEAVARYQARLGRPVIDLDWYEILALVRSSAILTRIAQLDGRAGRPVPFAPADHPILGILARRMAEAG